MRFAKLRLRLFCVGFLLIGWNASLREANGQLGLKFPSPFRLMSNTFQRLSSGAKNFIQWSPSSGNPYSTIPTGLKPQQSSYSVPQGYHTLAPVASGLMKPFPTPSSQTFDIIHRGNLSQNINSYSSQPVKYSPYSKTPEFSSGLKQDQRWQNGPAASYSSPSIFSRGRPPGHSFHGIQSPATQQYDSQPSPNFRHPPSSHPNPNSHPVPSPPVSPDSAHSPSSPFGLEYPGHHYDTGPPFHPLNNPPGPVSLYGPHGYENSPPHPPHYGPPLHPASIYGPLHHDKYTTHVAHHPPKYTKSYKSHKSHGKKGKGKGWGWGWGWSSKKIKKSCTRSPQVMTLRIASPEDLPPGFTVTTVHNVTLDPVALFTPRLDPIPVSPSVIKVGEMDDMPKGFKISKMENMVVDMSDRGGSNGLSMIREIHHFDRGVSNQDLRAARNAGANILSVTTLTYTSPNVSAPLYGNSSQEFQDGLNITWTKRMNKEIPPASYDLFQDQLSVLSNVFNDLRNVERRFFRQKINTSPQYGYQPMEVEAPIFDGEVQQWSVPEPDTGEKTILDSVYSFGQPAYRQEFATHDNFINSWVTMREQMERKRRMMSLTQFTGVENTFQSLNDRIVKRLRFYRRIAQENFLAAEAEASKTFKQYQFLLVPPNVDECTGPIDPTRQGMDRVIGYGGGSTTTQEEFE